MPSIGTAQTAANTEATLDEVQPVPDLAADPVVLHPANIRLVHASLVDQVLRELPDRIVGESRHQSGVQTEAAFQGPGDVVLAPAFPHAKFPGGVNPSLARV